MVNKKPKAPRYAIKGILGDNVQSDLIAYLAPKDRRVSITEVIEQVDYPSDEIVDELNRMKELGAIEQPRLGMVQLSDGPVGEELRDLYYETMQQERENQDLDRL